MFCIMKTKSYQPRTGIIGPAEVDLQGFFLVTLLDWLQKFPLTSFLHSVVNLAWGPSIQTFDYNSSERAIVLKITLSSCQ